MFQASIEPSSCWTSYLSVAGKPPRIWSSGNSWCNGDLVWWREVGASKGIAMISDVFFSQLSKSHTLHPNKVKDVSPNFLQTWPGISQRSASWRIRRISVGTSATGPGFFPKNPQPLPSLPSAPGWWFADKKHGRRNELLGKLPLKTDFVALNPLLGLTGLTGLTCEIISPFDQSWNKDKLPSNYQLSVVICCFDIYIYRYILQFHPWSQKTPPATSSKHSYIAKGEGSWSIGSEAER